ncbi:hypothetical protein ACFQ9X_29250 [Catenulispora yoronensis]
MMAGDLETDVYLILDGCTKVFGHAIDGRTVLLSIRARATSWANWPPSTTVRARPRCWPPPGSPPG